MRGISVKKLAKHVYNHYCTLFYQPDFKQLHSSVQQYLYRQAQSPRGLVESTGRHGYYRLRQKSAARVQQMMLNFDGNDAQDEKSEKPAEDLSLNLFDTF